MYRDFRLGTFLNSDLHKTPTPSKHSQITSHIVARDHVEHHVDTFAVGDFFHHRDEIFLMVVDRTFRAERFAGLAFFSRSRGDENPGAKGARELNGGGSDAARPAMDKYRLTVR